MAINTLITIKDALTAFVAGHGQLKAIKFEADDHRAPVITESDSFPLLFVAPIDVQVGRAMNAHTLRIYVYERINDDRSDVLENANDTSLILRDIRVWWNDYGVDDIEIKEDPTGIFVSDRELDNLVGYYADIRFEIPSHGRCSVPVDITPIDPVTCEDATYEVEYENGTPIESGSIPSGGFELIVVPNPVTCADAVVNVNSVFFDNVASGGTLNIEVRKSSGSDLVGSKQGQYWRIGDSTAVLKTSGGATISTTSIKAEESEDITAPDTSLEVNGTPEGTFAAGSTIEVNITDGVNPVTPDAVTVVGNVVTIEVPAATPAPVGATLMKTGQTTSYRTGDDGDLEAGRATDFFTLASNNPFGSTARFTDELGGSTYTNDIVIDWITYNGATVLGWDRRINLTGTYVSVAWATAIDNAFAHSVGTFTNGWRLPNVIEQFSLFWHTNSSGGVNDGISYSPFNLTGNTNIWSSTSYPPSPTTGAQLLNWRARHITFQNKVNLVAGYMACRTFTVTGTTLT
jgi:hypothetical protein